MSHPYACPVCAGTGLVSCPPWVAGDQSTWTTASLDLYECRACGGTGIVYGSEPRNTLIDIRLPSGGDVAGDVEGQMTIDEWLSEYRRGWTDCRYSGETGECDLTLIDEMQPTSKDGNTQTHPYWRGFYDAEKDIAIALRNALRFEKVRVKHSGVLNEETSK